MRHSKTAFFLLVLSVAFIGSVHAQTTPTASESSVGVACRAGSSAGDFDTLAQCDASSGTGTMQKAPLFAGTVTSPPYTATTCDANKAGMIQWNGSAFQGCDGSSWVAFGGGGGGASVVAGVIGASCSGYSEGTYAYDATNHKGTHCNQFALWSPINDAGSTTFSYTGTVQLFTVPSWVESITVDMAGAQGGDSWAASGNVGGFGGRVQTTLAVTAGTTISVYVGGKGENLAGGWNGGGNSGAGCSGSCSGGGGGASDMRIGGTALTDRVVVAGAGGGRAPYTHIAGEGGLVGTAGYGYPGTPNAGGQGGTALAGGAGSSTITSGTSGSLGVGGNGGDGVTYYNGAGGGGGYYGGGAGGGGNAQNGADAGGGGSSYSSGTGTTYTTGHQSSNGYVTISW